MFVQLCPLSISGLGVLEPTDTNGQLRKQWLGFRAWRAPCSCFLQQSHLIATARLSA